MAIILTGPTGTLAYWEGTARPRLATGPRAPFPQPIRCAFARLPAFAANGNHAPSGHEGAVTHDGVLAFLYQLAQGS